MYSHLTLYAVTPYAMLNQFSLFFALLSAFAINNLPFCYSAIRYLTIPLFAILLSRHPLSRYLAIRFFNTAVLVSKLI